MNVLEHMFSQPADTTKQHDLCLVVDPVDHNATSRPFFDTPANDFEPHPTGDANSRCSPIGCPHSVLASVLETGSATPLGSSTPPTTGVLDVSEKKNQPDHRPLPPPEELAQQTLLTTFEAAAYLRTTADAIRMRVHRGEIPKHAIVQRSRKGRLLFKRAHLDRHYGLTVKGGTK
jgi:excisionase family DNA binding protein